MLIASDMGHNNTYVRVTYKISENRFLRVLPFGKKETPFLSTFCSLSERSTKVCTKVARKVESRILPSSFLYAIYALVCVTIMEACRWYKKEEHDKQNEREQKYKVFSSHKCSYSESSKLGNCM